MHKKLKIIKFLKRKSDGKFYRGAKFWKWCASWRNAAALDEEFWETYIIDKITCEFELVTLAQIMEVQCKPEK